MTVATDMRLPTHEEVDALREVMRAQVMEPLERARAEARTSHDKAITKLRMYLDTAYHDAVFDVGRYLLENDRNAPAADAYFVISMAGLLSALGHTLAQQREAHAKAANQMLRLHAEARLTAYTKARDLTVKALATRWPRPTYAKIATDGTRMLGRTAPITIASECPVCHAPQPERVIQGSDLPLTVACRQGDHSYVIRFAQAETGAEDDGLLRLVIEPAAE